MNPQNSEIKIVNSEIFQRDGVRKKREIPTPIPSRKLLSLQPRVIISITKKSGSFFFKKKK